MTRVDKLLLAYLQMMEPVAVIAECGRPFRMSADIEIAIDALRPAGETMEGIDHCLWCIDRGIAAEVLAVATRRQNGVDLDRESSLRILLLAAQDVGVSLETESELIARAHERVKRLVAQFDEMSRAGSMQSLNRSYQTYRLKTKSSGGKPRSYSAIVNNHLKTILRTSLVAEKSAAIESMRRAKSRQHKS